MVKGISVNDIISFCKQNLKTNDQFNIGDTIYRFLFYGINIVEYRGIIVSFEGESCFVQFQGVTRMRGNNIQTIEYFQDSKHFISSEFLRDLSKTKKMRW